MHSHGSRKLITFVRVRDFGEEHAADFAPTSLATQLFTTIRAVVDKLEAHGASQASRDRNTRQGTAGRAEAREKLRERLAAMNLTARAMQPTVPGIEDQFRMPAFRDTDLLNGARAFLAVATPIADEFIAREMPADFLDGLRADIQAMEDAISEQQSTLGQRVAARTLIDASIEKGEATVRELNAIVRNKYANQPGILAQWDSVRHTERDPRRSSSGVTTSPSNSASANPSSATPAVGPSSTQIPGGPDA